MNTPLSLVNYIKNEILIFEMEKGSKPKKLSLSTDHVYLIKKYALETGDDYLSFLGLNITINDYLPKPIVL